MHKIFKYQNGTQNGGIPWANSGATSSVISTPTSSSLPNYRAQAQAINTQMTGTKFSQQMNSMITNGSRNPTQQTTTQPVTKNGITDNNPSGKPAGNRIYPKYTGQGKRDDPSKSTKVGNFLSQASGLLSGVIPQTPQSETTGALDAGFNATAGVVSMVSPLAGGIMAGVGAATDIARGFGLGTDQVTNEDKILDSKFLALTPLGLANSLGAKRAQDITKGLDYENIKADMGAGYGNAMDALTTAEKYAGKKIGNLFGQRSRANNRVNAGNYRLAQLERIWGKASIERAIQGTQSDMAFNKENLAMQGGWQDGAITFGRHGMIITPARMRMLRTIKQNLKQTVQEVQAFKNGGSFNVIPEGSLHARLHHMEDADGLTKKGIPVVVEKEGGELEQQAEIELNEIIFRLEVTSEIEKLMKDGSDNAAIECGKMLVKEIFENTQDRTGLIESLEEPKEDQGSVVKEHRVFQAGGNVKPQFEDWYKTVPEDRNDTTLYNLKRAYELEKWDQLEKWRNATPEQLKNDTSYHLKTFYFNQDGIGEFVKHRNHPTINGELKFYFGEDGKKFRDQYSLDTSGDYYKYVPRK